jgi:hypothetical protein
VVSAEPIDQRAQFRESYRERMLAAEAKLAKVRSVLPRGEVVLGGQATAEDAAYLHGQRSVWRQLRDALKDGES